MAATKFHIHTKQQAKLYLIHYSPVTIKSELPRTKHVTCPSYRCHWTHHSKILDVSFPHYVTDICFYILSSVLRTPCSRLFLQMLMVAQQVRYSSLLVETKGILSRSHQIVNGACPESTKSNPHIHTAFLQVPFQLPKPFSPASLRYTSSSHLRRECCHKIHRFF